MVGQYFYLLTGVAVLGLIILNPALFTATLSALDATVKNAYRVVRGTP